MLISDWSASRERAQMDHWWVGGPTVNHPCPPHVNLPPPPTMSSMPAPNMIYTNIVLMRLSLNYPGMKGTYEMICAWVCAHTHTHTHFRFLASDCLGRRYSIVPRRRLTWCAEDLTCRTPTSAPYLCFLRTKKIYFVFIPSMKVFTYDLTSYSKHYASLSSSPSPSYQSVHVTVSMQGFYPSKL